MQASNHMAVPPFCTIDDLKDVVLDGLPVGSWSSFVYNACISALIPLIGFLVTYYLHTTSAAKYGSLTGLGMTLLLSGYQMGYAAAKLPMDTPGSNAPIEAISSRPAKDGQGRIGGIGPDSFMFQFGVGWYCYVLMAIGWFVIITSLYSFSRAKKQEEFTKGKSGW